MKNIILSIIFQIRALVMRFLYPAPKTIWELDLPFSRKFGFDRGTPVDRVLIEKFLSENSHLILGRVLEIGDNVYTSRFGSNVTKSEILDINRNNKKATVYADLADMSMVPSNSFDTVLLTHVINLVEKQREAISEVYRILKPGGHVLLTTASLAPQEASNKGYTRYTSKGVKKLFEQSFKKNKIEVKDIGNVYVGLAFWIGMSKQDVPEKYFNFNDPDFPCVATLVAQK
jgi:SAM-dependent methyltransferase